MSEDVEGTAWRARPKLQAELFEVPTDIEREWAGMPRFASDKLVAYAELIVRFRNAADLQAFADLIGQPLTRKTKSIWIPPLAWGEQISRTEKYVDEE